MAKTINNTVVDTTRGQLPPLDPNKTRLGGSGAFGLIGGANLISAGKQILKSGLGRGALNFVKNVFKSNKNKTIQVPIIGQPGKTATVLKSSGTKQVSYSNPRISGRTGSKPVDFKGPNPAHKTGAGGNSY